MSTPLVPGQPGHPGQSGQPGQPRDVRVFLLDDHEVVRRGLRDLLDSEPGIQVIGEAGTAAQATVDILRLRPDVAVLDGRLPDGSGVEVARDVRSADPRIRVLILTSYDDDEALFAAITAGASGYLLKQMRGDDLIDAVKRVAAGQSLLDPAVTARVLERLRGGGRPDRLASLTEQEKRILGHIAEGQTNRQIAEELGLAEKTVKNHVSNLLGKLGLESRTQAAIFATKNTGGNGSGSGDRPRPGIGQQGGPVQRAGYPSQQGHPRGF